MGCPVFLLLLVVVVLLLLPLLLPLWLALLPLVSGKTAAKEQLGKYQ